MIPNKVCPLVFRDRALTLLLAFRHPLEGIQLVKGTIESGEQPPEAAPRELEEESGIGDSEWCRRSEHKLTDLPAGMHLEPGELRIKLNGAEELLRRLYELSQASANDYKKLRSVVIVRWGLPWGLPRHENASGVHDKVNAVAAPQCFTFAQ